VFEYRLRHSWRQFDGAVFRVQLDATDAAGIEPGLVRDGANDITRLDAVISTHLEAEELERLVALPGPTVAAPLVTPVATVVAVLATPIGVVATPLVAVISRITGPRA
jgi:hypothetical protein